MWIVHVYDFVNLFLDKLRQTGGAINQTAQNVNTGFHNAEIALDNKLRTAGHNLQQGASNVQSAFGNAARNVHDAANQEKQNIQVSHKI